MLDPSTVSIRESALLVIDAQDSFKALPRWERRNNPDFERNLAALIEAYRSSGLPVVFFLHTDPDPFFEPGSPCLKLMDFITRRPDELLIVKNTRNCFTSTGLRAHLMGKDVRRIPPFMPFRIGLPHIRRKMGPHATGGGCNVHH